MNRIIHKVIKYCGQCPFAVHKGFLWYCIHKDKGEDTILDDDNMHKFFTHILIPNDCPLEKQVQ